MKSQPVQPAVAIIAVSTSSTSATGRSGEPVTHFGLLGARGQHPRECPIRVGAEDHPLFRAVQGKAVVEQLGALLAPVAGPVAAPGAVAVEAGKTSKV